MTFPEQHEDWRQHLVDDDEGIGRIIAATRRIAVLGIKIDPDRPAHFVPAYAQRAGFEIVPVPVYYPKPLRSWVSRSIARLPPFPVPSTW
jgi:uncharacterized protein